jgi:hypothetical protein
LLFGADSTRGLVLSRWTKLTTHINIKRMIAIKKFKQCS